MVRISRFQGPYIILLLLKADMVSFCGTHLLYSGNKISITLIVWKNLCSLNVQIGIPHLIKDKITNRGMHYFVSWAVYYLVTANIRYEQFLWYTFGVLRDLKFKLL